MMFGVIPPLIVVQDGLIKGVLFMHGELYLS